MIEVENPERNPGPSGPRMQAIVLGLSIGLGIGAGKLADEALRPGLGWWPAFAIELVVAGVVAVGVAVVVNRLAR